MNGNIQGRHPLSRMDSPISVIHIHSGLRVPISEKLSVPSLLISIQGSSHENLNLQRSYMFLKERVT